MGALNEVSPINIQIADFTTFGLKHSLYIKKDRISPQFLVKIEEISKNHGLSVTSSDSHYIIM
jgi:hypothetical protein